MEEAYLLFLAGFFLAGAAFFFAGAAFFAAAFLGADEEAFGNAGNLALPSTMSFNS